MYSSGLQLWAQTICVAGWLLFAALAPLVLVRAARRAPRDLLLALSVAVAAFAVRAALPWGPMTPIDSERMMPLWQNSGQVIPPFASVASALGLLRWIGLSISDLLRWWGPIMGALAVAATYAAARVFSLNRAQAALAAVVVAAWPAHAHYSTGPTIGVEAGAFAMLTFTVATLGDVGLKPLELDLLAPPLLAALVTLTVYMRSEWRLIVVPVAVLALGPAWTPRRRGFLAAWLLVPLAAYLPMVVHPHLDQAPITTCGWHFLTTVILNPLSFGLIWMVAAIVGAWKGPLSPRVRVAFLFTLIAVGTLYVLRASDTAPQWSQWRYWSALVPFFALGAALSVALLVGRFPPRPVLGAAFALAVLPLPLAWKTLRAPVDGQATFAFVQQTAVQATSRASHVFLLFDPHFSIDSAAILGLAATGVLKNGYRLRCEGPLPPGGPSLVRAVSPATFACPDWIPRKGAVIFLGPDRQPEVMDWLRAHYTLEPIVQRTEEIVPDYVTDPSLGGCSSSRGLTGADYAAQLGWYRLRPRS